MRARAMRGNGRRARRGHGDCAGNTRARATEKRADGRSVGGSAGGDARGAGTASSRKYERTDGGYKYQESAGSGQVPAMKKLRRVLRP